MVNVEILHAILLRNQQAEEDLARQNRSVPGPRWREMNFVVFPATYKSSNGNSTAQVAGEIRL